MDWITDITTHRSRILKKMYMHAKTNFIVDRYNSRNNVSAYNIYTAYSWVYTPTISDDNTTITYPNYFDHLFHSLCLSRDCTDEAAVSTLQSMLGRANNIHAESFKILTLNTVQAQNKVDLLKEKLIEIGFVEMNVRTLVTITPNHKISMFKQNKTYIIFTNMYSLDVCFRTATAIMLDTWDNEKIDKDALATAYLAGNGNEVNNIITEYTKDYEAWVEQHKFEQTLDKLITTTVTKQQNSFIKRIKEREADITYQLDYIRNMEKELKKIKAEYMYFMLTNTSDNVKDLTVFLTNVKDHISHIEVSDSGTLIICYNAPLAYWEPETINTYLNSRRDNTVKTAPEHIKQLLIDVFVNKKYNLYIESGVSINIGDACNLQYTEPEARTVITGIPNPHHKYFNCWGDNASIIYDTLKNNNYVATITQIFTAMRAINLTDVPVLDQFIKYELEDYAHIPCLEVVDTKERITINQYKERLNVQN